MNKCVFETYLFTSMHFLPGSREWEDSLILSKTIYREFEGKKKGDSPLFLNFLNKSGICHLPRGL